MTIVGGEKRKAASLRLAKAQEAHGLGRAESEELAREALALYASALNWSEDSDEFEPIHSDMHDAGRWVRQTFGCELHQENGRYEQRCPVDLAHKRVGFSMEYVAKSIRCSICNGPIESCEHIVGRVYDGRHCHRIIDEIEEILGIALVSRPAQPDARMKSISIDTERLRAALPDEWRPGMPVSCDKCLRPCTGIEEVELGALREEGCESERGSEPLSSTIRLQ